MSFRVGLVAQFCLLAVYGQHVYLLNCAAVSPEPQADKFDDCLKKATRGEFTFKQICGGTPNPSPARGADEPMSPPPSPGQTQRPLGQPAKKRLLVVDEGQVILKYTYQLLPDFLLMIAVYILLKVAG